MNDLLMTKPEVLVALLKLAYKPMEELYNIRFEYLKNIVSKAKGHSCFLYMKENLGCATDKELDWYVDRAVKSEKGRYIREQNAWTEEEHRRHEYSEIKPLADFNKKYEEVRKKLINESYSLSLCLNPGTDKAEFIDSLVGLKGNNFGRCIQDWIKDGAIKKRINPPDLHRTLSEYLPYVPSEVTIRKAFNNNFSDKRADAF